MTITMNMNLFVFQSMNMIQLCLYHLNFCVRAIKSGSHQPARTSLHRERS